MNVLNFIGRIGKDAEIRHTPNGKMVTGFSVAMEAGWGDRKTTTWVACSMWGDRGEKVAPYLLKGNQIGVTGECSLRDWEANGKKGTSMECNVQNVTLCGEKREGGQAPRQKPLDSSTPVPAADDVSNDFDDSIPF